MRRDVLLTAFFGMIFIVAMIMLSAHRDIATAKAETKVPVPAPMPTPPPVPTPIIDEQVLKPENWHKAIFNKAEYVIYTGPGQVMFHHWVEATAKKTPPIDPAVELLKPSLKDAGKKN